LRNKEAQALAELHSSSASCCCAPVLWLSHVCCGVACDYFSVCVWAETVVILYTCEELYCFIVTHHVCF